MNKYLVENLWIRLQWNPGLVGLSLFHVKKGKDL